MIGLVSVRGVSQDFEFRVPDYDSIEMIISDSTSRYYYPDLMNRFMDRDTTLDLQDFRVLYYGYSFQDKYEPYWRSDYGEKIREAFSKPINEDNYIEILGLASKALEENPFYFDALQLVFMAFNETGNTAMAKKLAYQVNGILAAIMSTGDGKTCETAYHVISTTHEYVFLGFFGFEPKGQSLSNGERYCDYIRLGKNDEHLKGIYFDVDRLFRMNLENMK